ncbi:hypothetical protein SKAU_G00402450 [Synaphobranchus kaupii]|uniref:Uncharacterized protein n=1 Tax=Synaphobranchus kaupii TaxID=118154 RepID=A0A9Q1ICI2_SYNKA|nr:hypothetical protein SKAU_G00402450 [Synaphobranchus kaupii]
MRECVERDLYEASSLTVLESQEKPRDCAKKETREASRAVADSTGATQLPAQVHSFAGPELILRCKFLAPHFSGTVGNGSGSWAASQAQPALLLRGAGPRVSVPLLKGRLPSPRSTLIQRPGS